MKYSVYDALKTWTRFCALFLVMVPTANAQFMGDRQAKLVVTKPIQFMNETRKVERLAVLKPCALLCYTLPFLMK